MKSYRVRQPIVDREQTVFGYELLFRSGTEEFLRLDESIGNQELLQRRSHLQSLERIAEGRRCFIRFTRQQLLDQAYTPLPAATTVVEIEDSECLDTQLLQACQQARHQGYQVVLPYSASVLSMHSQCDLLKARFPSLEERDHLEIVRAGRERGFSAIASGLRNYEDFRVAVELGYTYFQGYFFCHPRPPFLKRLAGSHLQYLRMLQTAQEPEFRVDLISELLQQDLSLSVRLLTYLNSPEFALRAKVTSIRQAVGILGQRPLRKWISLITVNELSSEKPLVLINTSLIRGKFCESITERKYGESHGPEGFLLGMLSLLDVILDQPMEVVLKELALSPSLREALLQHDAPLTSVIRLARALEDGLWEQISGIVSELRLDEEVVFTEYEAAVIWAGNVFRNLQ